MGRVWLMWGCLFGFLTVALGAFAGHALEHTLEPKQMEWIHIANQYLMYHSMALLALGLWSHWEKWASSFAAGIFFCLGIILFCGSLYALALVDFSAARYVTPAGGVCFLLGWINFAVSVIRTNSPLV